jgi:UDP-N-acetylmuramoyl-tripeptide--D-alanyl-D-alanine ligase
MEQLFKLFYGTTGVSTDTRKINQDCLFICLRGDNFNGNEFVNKALELGAKYVICDEKTHLSDARIFVVDDCLLFLQELANFHRRQFSIPVIAITGSNGKTSTKELINVTLSKKHKVLATSGNLNNHIGVPLTLLLLTTEHEIALIEMGANKFKDIEELAYIAEPTHGVITNIGKAHLEGFKSFEGVLRTKRELYVSVADKKGRIILNGDDAILKKALPEGVTTLSYGQDEGNDVIGELVNITPYIEIKWHTKNYISPLVQTHMIGKYNFYNFLTAIAFGIEFGVEPEKINEALSSYKPTNNRSQITKTEKNTVIMDCYNANPTSMQSALESFALIDAKNKFVVLGDMLELGQDAILEHEGILELLKSYQLEGILVGPIFKSLIPDSNFNTFNTLKEAEDFLRLKNLSNYLILLKGSRGIGLEKLEPIL